MEIRGETPGSTTITGRSGGARRPTPAALASSVNTLLTPASGKGFAGDRSFPRGCKRPPSSLPPVSPSRKHESRRRGVRRLSVFAWRGRRRVGQGVGNQGQGVTPAQGGRGPRVRRSGSRDALRKLVPCLPPSPCPTTYKIHPDPCNAFLVSFRLVSR